MRLDKYLAEAAVGTRKAVRDYVKEGKVTVNGNVALEPALEINENSDMVEYQGEIVTHLGKSYFMFYKPGGCVSASKDKDNPTVLDYISVKQQKGLFPVGRLDKDTEGFLLLTNDGEFSHGLMHPKQHIEKTYFFWAFGSLNEEALEGLKAGVIIGNKEPLAKAIKIEVKEQGLYQDLKDRMDFVNHKEIRLNPCGQPVVSGYLTISEGRKHQVKRMLKAVGCYVAYLKRVSIGGVFLDNTLKKGQYRKLTEEEIRALTKDKSMISDRNKMNNSE